MSGRDARRARQRKAEQRRHEAGKARVGAVLAYLNAAEAAERRIMARFREYLDRVNHPISLGGGRYVENVIYWDGLGPPPARPAKPEDHTWTRFPARWSAVDLARGPDQSRQLTVDMLTRADAAFRASDGAPPYEIMSAQEYEQARAAAERATNAAIHQRRNLFR